MNFKFGAFADESHDSLEGQIDALLRNNYKYLEIRGLDGKSFTDLTLGEAREVMSRLNDNNVKIISLGSPIGKIQMNDDFEQHLELYKHTLELASVFGAKYIRLFSFFMPKGQDCSVYKDTVIERMGIFADLAKQHGVIACHENEKGIYGEKAAQCLEIHQAVPSLRAVFDPANFVQSGQDTMEAWNVLHPYVEYMHIKDARADGQVVAAGEGIGNVPQLVRNYVAQGGTLFTLEPHLFEFIGLNNLEQEGNESIVGNMAFATSADAFDYAANRFKKIVEEL